MAASVGRSCCRWACSNPPLLSWYSESCLEVEYFWFPTILNFPTLICLFWHFRILVEFLATNPPFLFKGSRHFYNLNTDAIVIGFFEELLRFCLSLLISLPRTSHAFKSAIALYFEWRSILIGQFHSSYSANLEAFLGPVLKSPDSAERLESDYLRKTGRLLAAPCE